MAGESAVGLRGTFSARPVWGGRWRWSARLGAFTRDGFEMSGGGARAAAIEALADLNRMHPRRVRPG